MVRIARDGLVVAIVAVLIFCGTAVAEKYIVKRDDCLSVIGANLNIDWRKIAKVNRIKHPYIIYPDQKLIIPEPDEYFDIKKLGRNPFKGVGNYELGWKQFNLSVDEIVELNKKIASGNFAWKSIRSGDVFDLGLEGKNILRSKPRMWVHRKGHNEAARVYELATGTEIWIPLKCGNPYLRKMSLGAIVIPRPTSKPAIIAERKKPFVYIPPEKKKPVLEHEPIVGAYAWKNDLARGWGGYGEYIAWLRKTSLSGYANGWSPGIGLYGMYSEGDSLNSSGYHWLEKGIGPQVGIKYIASGEKPWQWQGKLRLVWEEMKGSNNVGYAMEQDNLKLGFYTEYARKESKKWIWGATGEAWFALNRDIDSTWSGDRPSKRMTLASYIFAQRKLSDNWQLRGAGGIFYQGWDRLTGLRAQLEARYKETLMFGPWVSFFPFGLTSVYDGYSASDLTTVGGFVRLELGGIFREWDRNVRMSRIRKADKEWLDSL